MSTHRILRRFKQALDDASPKMTRKGGKSCRKRCSTAQPARRRPLTAELLERRDLLTTLTVNTALDVVNATDGLTSLREAITTANTLNDQANIVFNIPGGGTIALAAQNAAGARMLPVLSNSHGISIDGANGGQGAIAIDGGSTSLTNGDRVFFIGVGPGEAAAATGSGSLVATTSTNWSISNLTIQNGNARGGTGSGGGAGLGGAIFVNAGSLALSGVTFFSNRAVGGNGGSSLTGGGGMGGNGNAGGGGFGLGADGGTLASPPGGAGSFQGAASGGDISGTNPGGINGGGGASSNVFAGGAGGGVGAADFAGSSGGFGGGSGRAGAVGNGGFGGGGAAASGGGNGGFGGGGGSGSFVQGAGGFGAGNAISGSGGGGLGAGGAIFVRQGASVNILDGSILGGAVAGGGGGNNGQGIGSGIFLAGSATYSVSNGNTVLVGDAIGGGIDAQITGGFTKAGAGTLILAGNNNYTGGTTVAAGKLLLNGANTTTGAFTVQGSATLGGTGSLAGAVALTGSAHLAPGVSVESLDVGSVSFAGGTSFDVDIQGAAGAGVSGGNDVLIVTSGGVDLNGATLNVNLVNPPALGDTFTIINKQSAGPINGTFLNLSEGAAFTVGGVTLHITYVGGDGNDVMLYGTPDADVNRLIVTTTEDKIYPLDGLISLREAINYANTLTGNHTVVVGAGTYMLSIAGRQEDAGLTGDLDITGDVTIQGAGAATTIIDADGIDRVLHVLAGGKLTLGGVTVTGGDLPTLNQSLSRGGGILLDGDSTAIVNDSRITGNHAQYSGGGIHVTGISSFSNSFAQFEVNNSSIDGNTALILAGGIGADGDYRIVNSTISGNQSTSGAGGGILADSNYSQGVILNSTISSNTSYDSGGGIVNNGDLTLTNSTISGNTARIAGGGIANFSEMGVLRLINSTVVDNTAYEAGAITGSSDTSVIVQNSIITGNHWTSIDPELYSGPELDGTFISNGHNVIGYAAGSTGFGAGDNIGAPANQVVNLTLADNGGPTLTHALVPGSPALDAGDNAAIPLDPDTNQPYVTDQRGSGFLRVQNNFVDIGAVELRPTVTAADGALWYLGLPQTGSDLRVYREPPGGAPQWVDGGLAVQIGQASNGSILVKNSAGDVYAHDPTAAGLGSGYQVLSSVVAGDGAKWFLGPDGGSGNLVIYRWASGGYPTNSGGAGVQLFTTSGGAIRTINAANQEYERIGSATGLGTIWQQTETPSLVVTTTADTVNDLDNQTSLREALAYANAHPGADTVSFSAAVAGGTITLTSQLTLTETGAGNRTTIVAAAGGITISGNDLTRVFQVNAGVAATLEGLTLVHGYADQGGAIVNLGELALVGGVLRDNRADPAAGASGGVGGAISNLGTLHVAYARFESNTAAYGGAINTADGLTIANATFAANHADVNGGAVRVYGAASVSGSTFSNNAAGNAGGGLINHGNLTLTNSTLAFNTALDGAGLHVAEGPAELRNVTIAFNTASGGGGGAVANAPLTATNTIIAGNAAASANDLLGLLTPASTNNVINQSAAIAGLGTFANHGGPTFTVDLILGSPAINAGATIAGVRTDQRGVLRPFGASVDVGAIESQFPLPSVNPQSQTKNEGQTVTFMALADGLFAGTAPSSLTNGAQLLPGEFLLSPAHGYKLAYQTDGNMVLYRGDGVALWNSGTFGQSAGRAVMQADGNFVIYDASNVVRFSTGTFGNLGAVLKLQDDGNLVIYSSTNVPLFASSTGATGPSVVPTVQWQVSTDGGASFTNIPGETSLALSFVTSLADAGRQYRARFSNVFASNVPTTAATLTVKTVSADFDANGAVDGGDFLRWQRGLGIVAPNATRSDGDADNDGAVGASDLAIWKSSFGSAASVFFAEQNAVAAAEPLFALNGEASASGDATTVDLVALAAWSQTKIDPDRRVLALPLDEGRPIVSRGVTNGWRDAIDAAYAADADGYDDLFSEAARPKRRRSAATAVDASQSLASKRPSERFARTN